jgi:DNA-binding response OmpR family regulator
MEVKDKILIVEDEASIRETLEDLMLARDYEYVSFDNSEDAYLYLMNNDDIDLVLSDIMLPGRSGLDMLDSIRSRAKFELIPVILLTAKVEEEDVRLGIQKGADDYIRKPFKTKHLYAAIATQLERYKKLRTSQQRIKDTVDVQDELLESIAVINSHWVRAPLTNIFALLNLAEEQGQPVGDKEIRYMRAQLETLDEMLKAVAAQVNGYRASGSFRFREFRLPSQQSDIIAVDDDSMQLTFLKFLFRKHLPEATLTCYTSPEEALEQIVSRETLPDLLITDLQMSPMNGFDLVDQLLEKEIQLPVFILTSSMHATDIEKAMHYKNIYQFLQKPIDGQKLKQVFASSSDRSGSIQAWMSEQ